jgi:hypothetical protein
MGAGLPIAAEYCYTVMPVVRVAACQTRGTSLTGRALPAMSLRRRTAAGRQHTFMAGPVVPGWQHVVMSIPQTQRMVGTLLVRVLGRVTPCPHCAHQMLWSSSAARAPAGYRRICEGRGEGRCCSRGRDPARRRPGHRGTTTAAPPARGAGPSFNPNTCARCDVQPACATSMTWLKRRLRRAHRAWRVDGSACASGAKPSAPSTRSSAGGRNRLRQSAALFGVVLVWSNQQERHQSRPHRAVRVADGIGMN